MRRPSICILLVLMTVLATNVEAQIRKERSTFVGGEILGRGLFLTVNFERFVIPQVGLGAGVMGVGSSDGAVFILPLYASYVPGDIHSVYLSGGVTVLGGGGDAKDFESAFLITASVGYQYQSESGLFVRPLFSLIVPTEESDDFIIWPGIAIGGSF